VQIKVGIVDPANPNASREELQAVWDRFIYALEQERSAGTQPVFDQTSTQSVGAGMLPSHSDDSDAVAPPTEDVDEEFTASENEETGEKKSTRRQLRALRKKLKKSFEFVQGPQDVVGVVFMEVQCARDLPPERNGICLGEYP